MTARLATTDDAAEVVRLAALMFASMGVDTSGREWREAGERRVRERLGRDLAVFVVDHPDGGGRLVASAAGSVVVRLPGPHEPTGRAGYVQWVATEPSFRRRGLGRSVVEALLAWYDELGVRNVELHATPMAESLYRALGFGESRGIPLRRRGRDACA